jgi:hypothetical protein
MNLAADAGPDKVARQAMPEFVYTGPTAPSPFILNWRNLMNKRLSFLFVSILMLLLASCSSEAPKENPPEAPKPAADAAPAPPPTPDAAQLLYGTWVLNLSKSTYSPSNLAPKSNKVVYEEVPGGVHVTADGVNGEGKTTHTDYTATFDGPGIPPSATVDGKPNASGDTISWKKIDDHTYEVTTKRKEQIVNTSRIVIAADGKTRTSTITGKSDQGQINSSTFWERQ